MHDLTPDLRHAGRLLRTHAAFSAFVVVILATGIGATTLVFGLVDAALLRRLPFDDPERLVWMYNARTERDRAPFSIPDLEDYRRDATTLAGLAEFTNWTTNLTGIGSPERLEGTRVSGNFLPLLGVKPLLGRTIEPRDVTGDTRVVVITHGLWVRRFGGDRGIVGRTAILNGAGYTVVGVLPLGFVFPFREAELAVPIALANDARRSDRGANFLRVVARLRPGVPLWEAKADLDTIAHRLQHLYPDDDSRKTGVNLYPLHAEIVRDYRQILWTLFVAVGLLLAIACGNLGNLFLVRAIGREPELTLRRWLGASTARLVRQLATEAGVLAAVGGGLGVALAAWGAATWRTVGPANFPRLQEVGVDPRVLAFACTVSVGALLACAVFPAFSACRDGAFVMGDPSYRATSGRRQAAARRGFVMLQVGGSAVLLVCAGLLSRGFARLERVDPGFAPDHALRVQLSLPPGVYGTREAIARFYEGLDRRLRAVSGVREVGAVSLLPLSGLLSAVDVAFPDRPAPPPDEVPQAHFRIASPGYFAAAGIPVFAGRTFTDRDVAGKPPVAIVSRTFADRHWPGETALGKSVRIVQTGASPVVEVVGVASDVRQFAMDGPVTADLYVPIHQMPASQAALLAARMNWVVRTQGDPIVLAASIRRAVEEVDPTVATSSLRTLDDVVASSLGTRRVNVRLVELFGEAAIALSALGVYAVATFSLATRRRELAIRSVFGAGRRDLTLLVLRDELRPVTIGLAGGLGVALVASRPLVGTLFAFTPADNVTYLFVGAGLLTVAALAVCAAARRVHTSDPAELLRA